MGGSTHCFKINIVRLLESCVRHVGSQNDSKGMFHERVKYPCQLHHHPMGERRPIWWQDMIPPRLHLVKFLFTGSPRHPLFFAVENSFVYATFDSHNSKKVNQKKEGLIRHKPFPPRKKISNPSKSKGETVFQRVIWLWLKELLNMNLGNPIHF